MEEQTPVEVDNLEPKLPESVKKIEQAKTPVPQPQAPKPVAKPIPIRDTAAPVPIPMAVPESVH